MSRSKNFGIPYKGSKQKNAREIIDQMPPARNFYGLFAGGCAVAHAAMESGKYERVYVNDIDWRGPTLFTDAIAAFYAWAPMQDQPVYISEYAMPDGFCEVWRKEKRCTLASASNAMLAVEKLYVPEHQYHPCGELSVLTK